MVKSLIKRTKGLFSRREKNDDEQVKEENEKKSVPVSLGDKDVSQITIVGAGIVGLVLALAIDKHCGIKVDLFEQASAFHDDVGAGMGMYPNGLRVIRDISPQLLKHIQEAGYAYLLRRYEVRYRMTLGRKFMCCLLLERNQSRDLPIERWHSQPSFAFLNLIHYLVGSAP